MLVGGWVWIPPKAIFKKLQLNLASCVSVISSRFQFRRKFCVNENISFQGKSWNQTKANGSWTALRAQHLPPLSHLQTHHTLFSLCRCLCLSLSFTQTHATTVLSLCLFISLAHKHTLAHTFTLSLSLSLSETHYVCKHTHIHLPAFVSLMTAIVSLTHFLKRKNKLYNFLKMTEIY